MNRAAIYELLSWDTGCFAFTQEDLTSAADEIGAPTTLLLVDAALQVAQARVEWGTWTFPKPPWI